MRRQMLNSNESRFPSYPLSKSKFKSIQNDFEVAKTFISRLILLEPSASGFSSMLASAEKTCNNIFQGSSARITPQYKQARELSTSWNSFVEQVKIKIELANKHDHQKCLNTEQQKLSNAIEKVASHPPATTKAQKDSKAYYQEIMATLNEIKGYINEHKNSAARKTLRKFRTDLLRKYEQFFRLSQISKSWKSTVSEECRYSVDRIIALLDILGGTVEIPPEFDSISNCLVELSKRPEQSTPEKKRSSSSLRGTIVPPLTPLQSKPKITDGPKKLEKRSKSTSMIPKPVSNITQFSSRRQPLMPNIKATTSRKLTAPKEPTKQKKKVSDSLSVGSIPVPKKSSASSLREPRTPRTLVHKTPDIPRTAAPKLREPEITPIANSISSLKKPKTITSSSSDTSSSGSSPGRRRPAKKSPVIARLQRSLSILEMSGTDAASDAALSQRQLSVIDDLVRAMEALGPKLAAADAIVKRTATMAQFVEQLGVVRGAGRASGLAQKDVLRLTLLLSQVLDELDETISGGDTKAAIEELKPLLLDIRRALNVREARIVRLAEITEELAAAIGGASDDVAELLGEQRRILSEMSGK